MKYKIIIVGSGGVGKKALRIDYELEPEHAIPMHVLPLMEQARLWKQWRNEKMYGKTLLLLLEQREQQLQYWKQQK